MHHLRTPAPLLKHGNEAAEREAKVYISWRRRVEEGKGLGMGRTRTGGCREWWGGRSVKQVYSRYFTSSMPMGK